MKYFNPNNPLFPEYNPKRGFFVFLLVFIVGYVVAQAVGLAVVTVGWGLSEAEIMGLMANPDSFAAKSAILSIQAIGQLIGFAGSCWLFVRLIEKSPISAYLGHRMELVPFFLTLLLTVLFMVVNSVVIEWNMSWQFEGAFWEWARQQEDQLEMLTKQLSQIYHFPDFLFTFFVIAIVAGVTEELVFRGIIQTKLWQWTSNVHVAIWVSAFIFSAIHLQFFGFVPRLLLGALFGYLFYFSGNIWYAVWAHVVNNGVTIILLYYMQLSGEPADLNEMEAAPWWMALFVAVICLLILKRFFDHFNQTRDDEVAMRL
jgi:uncharacterized protein